MAISAVCPACRASFRDPNARRGSAVRCPQCDAVFPAHDSGDGTREVSLGLWILGGVGVLALLIALPVGWFYMRHQQQVVRPTATARLSTGTFATASKAVPSSMGAKPTPSGLASSQAVPAAAAAERGGDWPQWQGPQRNNKSPETGLLQTWPKGGPPLVWTFEHAGVGYSGPAVVGDRLYTLGGRNKNEYLIALGTARGEEIWSLKVGGLFTNGWGDGPRSTPTVDGYRIFALGGQGDLICADRELGVEMWRVSLSKDLGGQLMSGWGYSESPLVDGDKLICSPGGSQGTLAALDKLTGKVLWRSQGLTDPAAYSSVVVAEVGGVRQYVQMTNSGVVGVAADDGRLLWRNNVGSNGTAVIPTPTVHDNLIYVTSGYGAGCGLLKLLLKASTREVMALQTYANKTMQNQHGGVVLLDDHVYGYSDGGGWVCQSLMTGLPVWTSRKLGKGSVTYADGRLYCYCEEDGTVALVEPTPTGWKEHGRFTIPRETTLDRKSGMVWTHPVVAHGRLYLRDQDLLFSFDVRAAGR